jgi:hypothetical protein
MDLIEFVCGGNFGRSPLAELIAQNYLREIGKDHSYSACSSGAIVDAIDKHDIPLEKRIDWIGRAIRKGGVFSQQEKVSIEEALAENDSETILAYGEIVQERLHGIESEYRDEALLKYKICGRVKETREQTRAEPGRVAVLSVTPQDNEKVIAIYTNAGYRGEGVCFSKNGSRTFLDTILNFAVGSDDGSLYGQFGKTREQYFQLVEKLIEVVPMAVDKAIQ